MGSFSTGAQISASDLALVFMAGFDFWIVEEALVGVVVVDVD